MGASWHWRGKGEQRLGLNYLFIFICMFGCFSWIIDFILEYMLEGSEKNSKNVKWSLGFRRKTHYLPQWYNEYFLKS